MAKLSAFFHAFDFIFIGIIYFAILYWAVEVYIVRKKVLNDYQLKVVDFVWTCTSGVVLFLLLLSTRENSLKDQIDRLERHSAEIQQAMKMRFGTAPFECMAGTWPPGAVKGKSYQENGSQQTDPCNGVSGVTQIMYGFFTDEFLWQPSLSLDTGERFETKFKEFFDQDSLNRKWAQMWTRPIQLDGVGRTALEYYRRNAQEVVNSKRRAGLLSFEKEILHAVVSYTTYWPFLLATAFALRLGKARLDLAGGRKAGESAPARR